MEPTMSLPSNEKSFDISLEGDMTKKMWTGKFKTVCVPNLRQRADAAVLEKQLNRDLTTLDDNTQIYHRIVAQLSARIMGAPDWWIAAGNGQELLDMNIVFEVWKGCVQAETEWREQVWGKPEAKKEVENTSAEPAAKEE